AELRPVASGEVGEICVRGPAVFAGYHDNDEATAKALRGGWFHTGDLGKLDERGLLYITGRESDMYISGGSHVYPRARWRKCCSRIRRLPKLQCSACRTPSGAKSVLRGGAARWRRT